MYKTISSILTLFLLALSQPVLAHGGGMPRLVNTVAGPYRLYAWTKPEPIRVGFAHFTIGVFEIERTENEDVPVFDAQVEVRLSPLDPTKSPLRDFALRENSPNKLYYELDIDFPSEGEWQADIVVTGSDGSGTAQFTFEVLHQASNWPLIVGIGMLVVGSGWFLWKSYQHQDRRVRK